MPLRLQSVEGPLMKVIRSVLGTVHLYLQEIPLVLISPRCLVDPRAVVRPEGLSLKIPVTPAEIETSDL
jgi:hypothetical protein